MECSSFMADCMAASPYWLILCKVFQIQGLGVDFGCNVLILNAEPVKS